MFQTASLYSIEVDYYNYGTCEITQGSYFCGDHSCNTFKHVGKRPYAAVISEHREEVPKYPMHIYSKGTGITDGSRDSADSSSIVNYPAVEPDVYTQTDPHGYPLRGDAVAAQYHLHDGMKLSAAMLAAWLGAQEPAARNHMVKQDQKMTLVAGKCKSICDTDATCKAFQENRWEAFHTTIKCTTFHFEAWPSETGYNHLKLVPDMLVANEGWDLYEKYTLPKSRPWLFAPTTTAFQPTTHAANGGRRLDGVY